MTEERKRGNKKNDRKNNQLEYISRMMYNKEKNRYHNNKNSTQIQIFKNPFQRNKKK